MRRWVQITSGRGPIECAWVIPRVLRCMQDDAARLGLTIEVLDTICGPARDTIESAMLAVHGTRADELLAGWTGTILWIGRSPFRPGQKRKNWFVAVEAVLLPEKRSWSEDELKFETMRSSGPGGQHVNKTESAVRVTHLPTGTAATAREERSQTANRKLALARLAGLLAGRAKADEVEAQRQRWSLHNALERGNPIRVYKGPQFELRRTERF